MNHGVNQYGMVAVHMQKIISFDEITSVKRAKTAGIFPTAIELIASEKKVV